LQTVADRQVQQEETKELSWVGLLKSNTISGTWCLLLPISASGPFSQLQKSANNSKAAKVGQEMSTEHK
jgi:hypothetical protein